MKVTEAYDVLSQMDNHGIIMSAIRSVKTDDGVNATQIHCRVWDGFEAEAGQILSQHGKVEAFRLEDDSVNMICTL